MPLDKQSLVVVAGAGGFIGGHLVASLLRQGHTCIRAVDIKPPELWFQRFDQTENMVLDLRLLPDCDRAARGARYIFNLAADMGGMGFIESHKVDCMLSVLISTHMLVAAQRHGCERLMYASSACVYAAERQTTPDVAPLREPDAYPAMPEDGYGWEKLFSERMCRHYHEEFGLRTRVARFHNIYGPLGTFGGGREKAPAAICRKVVEAKLSGSNAIEIWGDGQQTRSFTYIDDCLRGTQLLMASDCAEPLNVGSDELVTINELVDIVEEIAGLTLARRYNPDAPKGVRGRNSDNTLIRSRLDWAPSTRLRDGMEATYRWIYDCMAAQPRTRWHRFVSEYPSVPLPRRHGLFSPAV